VLRTSQHPPELADDLETPADIGQHRPAEWGGEHRDEPDEGRVFGEDPDDVCAAADLAVEALQRVGRSELGPVLGGKA